MDPGQTCEENGEQVQKALGLPYLLREIEPKEKNETVREAKAIPLFLALVGVAGAEGVMRSNSEIIVLSPSIRHAATY
jgi:hypothetical protein